MGGEPVKFRRVAIVVAVVLLAAACQPFGPGHEPGRALNVHVGPPGVGGARVVDVTAANSAPGTTRVFLDHVGGTPVGPVAPAALHAATLDGAGRPRASTV